MAEYDPSHQGGAWTEAEEDGYEVADGDQQENNQNSTDQDDEDQEEEEAEYSVDSAPHALGDPQSPGGTTDDVGDYDPESVTFAPVPGPTSQIAEHKAPSKPSPQPAAKKPRTAGGFLVGDSDSEDEEDGDGDDAPVPAASGPAAGQASQSNSSHRSPPQASTNHNVSADAPSRVSAMPQVNAAVVAPANGGPGDAAAAASSAPAAAASSARQVPQDRIAMLEERVKDDPRGALDAWMALITDYRAKNNLEETRQIYERFLAIFPTAADVWVSYLEMELGMNNFYEAERIFNRCLLTTPNVNLWTKYLDYIRRRNDLNDSTGQARQIVARSYEFVIDNIGLDKDSGKIWADYIQFIKFGPGTVGGSNWQDMQKMDQLRKAYQRAICVPIANVNTLWKEYDQFEMGLNKLTGRKYLAEKSPSYMSAKSANTALDNITRNLQRTNLPRLPPGPGFEGHEEFLEQVEIWKKWIAWEKSDPLDLKDDKDQPELFHKRILYVYNQALMALRFWPEMWVDAAQWCIDNDVSTIENGTVVKDGNANATEFLTRGIEANPESVLLALKHADLIESTFPIEENDESKIARGQAVREPYNKVLDTLYGIIQSLKDKQAAEVAKIEEMFGADTEAQKSEDDDEDDADSDDKPQKEGSRKAEQIKAIQKAYTVRTDLLGKTISFVWIALIRAMRRIQGKGKPGTPLGGMRQAFIDSRQRGRLTSDVYAAVAQLEWTIYKDPAGGKIFDRGARLFPEDENFTLENIKYLHSKDDFTNARVLFETVVNRLTQKPETVHKAKPLYAYFHKYESQFGELAQIAKLEKRMAELFPEDPKLAHFNARYSTDKFDPIKAPILVSSTQMRPKLLMPSIEQPSLQNSPGPAHFATRASPRPQFMPAINSPKRPLPIDDFDEPNPPRKMQRNEQSEFQRGVSPLKGAAGRRLDQQRRMQGQGAASYTAAPAPIARDITFLLGLIPRAEAYDYHRFSSAKMVHLLRDTVIPDYTAWKANKDDGAGPGAALRGGAGHNRHASTEYGGYQNRDSPAPQGRPMSPYPAGGSRLVPASATYRQTSLRPGSSGSYEPPPAVYQQQGGGLPTHPPPQQAQTYAAALPPQVQYDGASAWPPQYGQPPPQQNYLSMYGQQQPSPQSFAPPRYPY
ncbi:hypothetical protein QBC46DRAFT_428204 [Diplogelasinospora grovesii]|uniref:mRNA 3'-end-processing protein RNA14 n=1 Tax=Diplogelasinospora grovesii TaxID=303347 RepID=A0AAN6NBI7_9PEZI|nr:hypothetical protein QBC46DRAFT_428204 [Diplogelasinospora grovesii]